MLSDEFKAFFTRCGREARGLRGHERRPGLRIPARRLSRASPCRATYCAKSRTADAQLLLHVPRTQQRPQQNNNLRRGIPPRARIRRRRADDYRRCKTDARPQHRAAAQNRGSPRRPRLDRAQLPARHPGIRPRRPHIDAPHRRAARLRGPDTRTALRRMPRLRLRLPAQALSGKHGRPAQTATK